MAALYTRGFLGFWCEKDDVHVKVVRVPEVHGFLNPGKTSFGCRIESANAKVLPAVAG